jgi:hypothetical protein
MYWNYGESDEVIILRITVRRLRLGLGLRMLVHVHVDVHMRVCVHVHMRGLNWIGLDSELFSTNHSLIG